MSSSRPFPEFRFHPDPVGSGSVITSERRCVCCGQARGWVYTGPVYATREAAEEALCPWCIASGSAHQKFGAEFVDAEALDAAVPADIVIEIAQRTPGFSSWQGERWLSCCGAPAAFVAPAGRPEISQRFPRLPSDLMPTIVHELGISGGAARQLLDSLDRDGGPTAYVFQCRTCSRHLAYIDRP